MGVDEVGVGCLAGPTYICAFKAPKDWFLEGVKDSKKFSSEKKREKVYDLIRHDSKYYGCSIKQGSVYDIDSFGIKGAIINCYFEAIMELGVRDTLIIIDGNRFKEERYEYEALVGGDDLIPHISAASITAKVCRDRFMRDQHVLHPEYNWAKNKGYGSPEHMEALKKFGPAPQHRRSFEPVKSMVSASL
jgi:ribonuclease HII